MYATGNSKIMAHAHRAYGGVRETEVNCVQRDTQLLEIMACAPRVYGGVGGRSELCTRYSITAFDKYSKEKLKV